MTTTDNSNTNEDKISHFRSLLEDAISSIAAKTDPAKRCLILSGGVDTCAILAAAAKRNVTFAYAITVVVCTDQTGTDTDKEKPNYGPDEPFARVAAQHQYPDIVAEHVVLQLSADDLVQTYLPACVQVLHTFDGMTLRNSLVIAAAFSKAAELGCTDALVGDAADELLGGYSFMWGNENDPNEWKEKRNKMCRQWTFATGALADRYNISSRGPYLNPQLVEWVLEHVERSDCIGTRPIRLVYQGETQEHITGKMILRQAYDTVASWRRKDPIEVGSGITAIGKDNYWKDRIPDQDFQSQKDALMAEGFVIKDKESLVNFRAFQKCFGEIGQQHPTAKRLDIGKGCAGCCFDIGDKTFCTICGAYPAQRQQV